MAVHNQRPTLGREHKAARFDVRFPGANASVPQDRESCQVRLEGNWQTIRFHDYHEVYRVPGLYEEIFYRRLKCNSPERVVGLLDDVLSDFPESTADLRALDVGAGNGMVGEVLRDHGVPCVIGLDILPEAMEATVRDRPSAYDDYFVADLTCLEAPVERQIRESRLNCLTTVAALGFGDIPTAAFVAAANLVTTPAWVAFNIKEDFLDAGSDNSGFCTLVHRLTREKILQVQSLRRYRHRLSVHGEPLHYVAIVAVKQAPIPPEWGQC